MTKPFVIKMQRVWEYNVDSVQDWLEIKKKKLMENNRNVTNALVYACAVCPHV